MPFVRIPTTPGRPAAGSYYLGISCVSFVKNKQAALAMSFGHDLIIAIGWEGADQRVDVLEGIDTDAGTFMLEATKTGGYKLSSGKDTTSRSLRISMSKIEHYTVTGVQKFQECEFAMDKQHGILVQVPQWLRYKHQQGPINNPFPRVVPAKVVIPPTLRTMVK